MSSVVFNVFFICCHSASLLYALVNGHLALLLFCLSVKSSQVKLPLIKTSDNRTSFTST